MIHEKLSLSGQDNTNLSKLKPISSSKETTTNNNINKNDHKLNKLICDESSSNNFENINETSVLSTFYFNFNTNTTDTTNSINTNKKIPILYKRNSLILDAYSTKQRRYLLELKQQPDRQKSDSNKNLLAINSQINLYRTYSSQSCQSLTNLITHNSCTSPLSISSSYEKLTNEKKETSQLFEPNKENRIENIKQKLMSSVEPNKKENDKNVSISSLALQLQKSLLKKPLPPSSPLPFQSPLSPSSINTFTYDSDLNLALLSNECDDENESNSFLNQLKTKLESCQLQLLPSTESKDQESEEKAKSKFGSMKGNLLIVSRQGTVRGSLNHVKTSLKEIFKEPKITNPVLNAQLNNTNNEQLIRNNNIKNKEDSNSNTISKMAQLTSTELNKKEKFSTIHYFLARNYEEEEHQKIVIYTTSLVVVRLSFDKCKRVKKILQNYCVRYEERDLHKNKEYQRELKYRLNLKQIDVPHIFFNGKHIGKIKLRIYCSKCGGYRFNLCTLCNGSKKIFNSFTNLKCTNCNEDGLIRCDECLDQQE